MIGSAYTFDRVFSEDCSTADVYAEVARPVLSDVMQGYNGMFTTESCEKPKQSVSGGLRMGVDKSEISKNDRYNWNFQSTSSSTADRLQVEFLQKENKQLKRKLKSSSGYISEQRLEIQKYKKKFEQLESLPGIMTPIGKENASPCNSTSKTPKCKRQALVSDISKTIPSTPPSSDKEISGEVLKPLLLGMPEHYLQRQELELQKMPATIEVIYPLPLVPGIETSHTVSVKEIGEHQQTDLSLKFNNDSSVTRRSRKKIMRSGRISQLLSYGSDLGASFPFDADGINDNKNCKVS